MSRREPGIPTTHAGTRFRSRLEARWAAFFDAIGWRWEYEPFDLAGYIPDFAILGPRPLLVEVKPALAVDDLDAHISKAETAADTRDVLLVGATPLLPSRSAPKAVAAGLLVKWHKGLTTAEGDWSWCNKCDQIGVWHTDDGRVNPCGHDDPRAPRITRGRGHVERVWPDARNRTQWKP